MVLRAERENDLDRLVGVLHGEGVVFTSSAERIAEKALCVGSGGRTLKCVEDAAGEIKEVVCRVIGMLLILRNDELADGDHLVEADERVVELVDGVVVVVEVIMGEA